MTALVRLLAVGLVALTLAGAADAARVPVGVSSIRIRSATGVTTTVTHGGQVRAIVQAFDGLHRFVARPCPDSYTPPDVTFDFRSASGAVLLHAVDHAPGTCSGSIAYRNDGEVKYAPLAEGNFVARVARMIGVDIDPSAPTVANRRLAKREAAQLLRLGVVPAGSIPLTTAPIHEFASCASGAAPWSGFNFCRMWKVNMPLDAVLAFERAHEPSGSKITRSDSQEWRRRPLGQLIFSKALTFTFPGVRHRVWTRDLAVDMVSLTPRWTAIEIGAQAVWVVGRSPLEVVPVGVRTIVIRKTRPAPPFGWAVAHRVTSRRTIATITRWFNALQLSRFPAGACKTGLIPGASAERIAFLSGSGQVLARANAFPYGAVSGQCTPIDFSVGGRKFPALLGGRFLIRVEKLLR